VPLPTISNRSRLSLVPTLVCVVYATALVALAVDPTPPEIATGLADTHAHAIAYGVQAALLYWALSSALLPLVGLGAGWLGAGALGVTTEILQLLVSARSSEAVDIVADVFGATVVVVGVLLARRIGAVLRVLGQRRAGRRGEREVA